MAWEHLREEAKNELSLCFGKCSISGTFSIEATISSYSCPVGIIWFHWVGNSTIELLYSFVLPELRRCGIRTKMHKILLEGYKSNLQTIITGAGTKDGKPWLKKMKFCKQKNGDYILKVK